MGKVLRQYMVCDDVLFVNIDISSCMARNRGICTKAQTGTFRCIIVYVKGCIGMVFGLYDAYNNFFKGEE